MENSTLLAIKEHVSTQYGDLTGVIQIDGHSNISSIYDMCIDYNLNTEDKFIVGFELSESTTEGIGQSEEVFCSIFYVQKSEYGEDFATIKAKILEDNGVLRLERLRFSVKYKDLGKYIKRYDYIVMSQLTNYANQIVWAGEE